MTVTTSLEEWLIDRGLTPQEADLWADFIADALDLIDDGHALLRKASEWNSFLGGCVKPVPTEPEITSGLGDRMRRLRNEAPIDSNRDRIQVSYESPTPGDERKRYERPLRFGPGNHRIDLWRRTLKCSRRSR
ncbi:hypothetical protein, partial [Azospirillum agricola]|uniref:hypothetical protein n=1 Tax=Azospirillum agricola TaxID=1720247 RepID=UPI001AE9CE51